MLVDFHTHCFPEKIAPLALEKLSFASGGLHPYTNGTVEGLKDLMARQGVDKAVVIWYYIGALQKHGARRTLKIKQRLMKRNPWILI